MLDELGRLACAQGDCAQAKDLFDESLSTAQGLWDHYRTTRALCDLGIVAYEEKDYAQAQAYLKQIADGVQDLKGTPLPAEFFLAVVHLACITGPSERAARLMGAAQAAIETISAYLGVVNRAEYEATWSTLRMALGGEVFDRACAEGQAMSLEAALAYATNEVLS